MTVLVTGADGFIGRALCSLLARRSHTVIGTTRREPRVGVVRVPDIGPETDWSAVLNGIDTVVHLAARVHIVRDRAADPLLSFRRVNRDGTARLLAASRRAGVSHFIFASTIGVVCENSDEPVSEATSCVPRTPYAISKLEAESVVLAESGMRVVVLRPPMVYGPAAPGNFGRLVRAVAAGAPLPFGLVTNRRSFIARDNLADAVARAVEDHRARGVYHLADGPAVSTAEFIRMIANALGRRPRLLPIPPRVLRFGARLTGMAPQVNKLVESLPVDCSRFQRELDWRAPLSMEDALRACLSTS